MRNPTGRVLLVGAGPGDPDLLTVKAARALGEADVVVYDRLVSEGVLALVPEGTPRLFVGKMTGHHHMPQAEINRLLVRLARSGHRVVRLKGGDPFVFGRGGEEALHLASHDVDFEVVPGVTAATACAAYAGIPVTHRGSATSVRLVTGHCREDRPLELDWRGLADADTTLVIYMGLANVPELCARLGAAGLHRQTPVAVVESGTLPTQRVEITTLAELPATVRERAIASPALVVIGRVVALSEQLAWFDAGGGEPRGALARA